MKRRMRRLWGCVGYGGVDGTADGGGRCRIGAPSATRRLGSGPYRADHGSGSGTAHPYAVSSGESRRGAAGCRWWCGVTAPAPMPGDRFRWFLSDIASYGYLVIAVGSDPESVRLAAAGHDAFAAGRHAGHAARRRRAAGSSRRRIPRSCSMRCIGRWRKMNARAVASITAWIPKRWRRWANPAAARRHSRPPRTPQIRTTVLWNSGLFPGGHDHGRRCAADQGQPEETAWADRLHQWR